jgi:hypothetical protein
MKPCPERICANPCVSFLELVALHVCQKSHELVGEDDIG